MRTKSTLVLALGALAVLTLVRTPAAAQTPRLTHTFPGELMVDRRDGTTTVVVHGEEIYHTDVRWTWRLYRYYARRAGEATWRRLYLNPQGSWYESPEQLAPLQANGVNTHWGGGTLTFELPNEVYFRAPGGLELRVERGEWHERSETRVDFVVEAASNTLRVPIRAAPTEAPVVTRVDPAHVPVVERTTPTSAIIVHADNLMPNAEVRIGTEPCEIARMEVARGWVECRVPRALQSKPGMYLVGVSTANGGARQLAQLHVQAPLRLARPNPSVLPAADTVARVLVSYEGGAPLQARVRAAGSDWRAATFEAAGRQAVKLTVAPALTVHPGALELELSNAAGPAVSPLLVCGGEGQQPKGCPVSLADARPPVLRTSGARVTAARPAAERATVAVDPRDPVSLRPQPEPPGLTRVPLAEGATLRLNGGGTVAWRRVEGDTRLVLVGTDGKVTRTFDPGAQVTRDAAGRVYVKLASGVVAVGQLAGSR